MESGAPHLITIPRELRDIVYENLTRKIGLHWDWVHGMDIVADTDGLIPPGVRVHLLNYPLPAVSRAYSRMRDEYRDASCFRELEAWMKPYIYMCRTAHSFKPHSSLAQLNDDSVARVRHATLLLDIEYWFSQGGAEDWSLLLDFLRVVAAKMPHLGALRVAVKTGLSEDTTTFPDHEMNDKLAPAANRLGSSAPEILPFMPGFLGGMPLLQRGEGYQVGYSRTIARRSAAISPVAYTYKLGGAAQRVVFSRGQKIGVYTYAHDIKNAEPRFWTSEEAVAQWPVLEYPEEALENVWAEKAERWAKLPFEMDEWVERRGAEDV
jgi:hypothetical protein